MDDLERSPLRVAQLVRREERGREIAHDAQRDGEGQPPTARGEPLSDCVKRAAVDVVHHERKRLTDDLMDAHDVRVTNARREPRLVEEHGDELGVFGHVRVQPLQRDVLARRGVTRELDARHPARGDRADDFVSPCDHAEPRALEGWAVTRALSSRGTSNSRRD